MSELRKQLKFKNKVILSQNINKIKCDIKMYEIKITIKQSQRY